jgi:hypothetical protein
VRGKLSWASGCGTVHATALTVPTIGTSRQNGVGIPSGTLTYALRATLVSVAVLVGIALGSLSTEGNALQAQPSAEAIGL